MAADPFDDLLSLEEDFYKEGFEAGLADSVQAGLLDGKLFGIEKGYEKALELGKAYGRALVWQQRLGAHQHDGSHDNQHSKSSTGSSSGEKVDDLDIKALQSELPALPDTPRLKKNIETLLHLADPATVSKENTDDSVSEFDDRLIKIGSKLKIISKAIDEPLASTATAASSIEDSNGLSARH
jgi:mRNA export factor